MALAVVLYVTWTFIIYILLLDICVNSIVRETRNKTFMQSKHSEWVGVGNYMQLIS